MFLFSSGKRLFHSIGRIYNRFKNLCRLLKNAEQINMLADELVADPNFPKFVHGLNPILQKSLLHRSSTSRRTFLLFPPSGLGRFFDSKLFRLRARFQLFTQPSWGRATSCPCVPLAITIFDCNFAAFNELPPAAFVL
jgi:hypothetical protein